MIPPLSYRKLRKLHVAKPFDESWLNYARRLGIEARFEGRPLVSNPFPSGFLSTQWEDAWETINAALGRIE